MYNVHWSSERYTVWELLHQAIVSFSQKLNLLKSLYFLLQQARLDFYFKVIFPSITYGLLIWGTVGKSLQGTLEKIHMRAARIIFNLGSETSTEEVKKITKWRSLKYFYNLELLRLVFNCYHGLVPLQLQNLFIKRERPYNFRKINCLCLPKPQLDIMKKSISYQGSALWNSLDNDIRTSSTFSLLKDRYKQF